MTDAQVSITRRRLLWGAAAALPGSVAARAQGFGQAYALKTDAGDILPNFKVPPSLDPALARGRLTHGSATPDVTIYEFFDYQCPYCRSSAKDLDALVANDPALALVLINNPILSVGSAQTAKVQQAVLKLHGDQVAYGLHLRLLAERGQIDGLRALALTKAMGLDDEKIAAEADSQQIVDVMISQIKLAANLGLNTTPSFVVDGVGLLGWPGLQTLRRVIASVRACDRPVCGKPKL